MSAPATTASSVESTVDPRPATVEVPLEGFVDRLGVYSRVCLVVAAVLVPLSIHVATTDSFMLVKLTVLWVLVALALAFSLSGAVARGRWFPSFRMGYAALALVGAYGVATVFSLKPGLSLIGLSGRYGGLLPMLLYVGLMFVVVAAYSDRPGALRTVLGASVTASTIVGGYVLVQAAGLDWQIWNGERATTPDYPIGTLGNSNFAGAYLAISLPLVLYFVLTVRRAASRVTMGVILAVHVLALWYTQTRGGMFAAVATVVVMALLSGSRIHRLVPKIAAAAVAVVVAGAVLVIWHPGLDRAPGPASLVRTSTLENRVYFWKGALKVFGDHPLVGTGPDTFYAYYHLERSTAEAEANPLVVNDKPHNIFFEYASNTGILGIGSYLALVGLALGYGLKALRSADSEHQLLLACVVSAFVGYLVQGFFSFDVPPLAFMGWLLLGAIAVLADPGVTRSRQSGELAIDPTSWPVRQRRAAHGLVVAGTLALVFVGTLPLRADVHASAGRIEAAMRMQPFEAEYPTRGGKSERSVAVAASDPQEQLDHFRNAEAYLLKARRLKPRGYDLAMEIALVNSLWARTVDPSRFVVAQAWWDQAMAENPQDPGLRENYRNAVLSMEENADELEGLAKVRPDDVEAWLAAARAHMAVKNVEKARAAADQALRIDPDNPVARGILDELAP